MIYLFSYVISPYNEYPLLLGLLLKLLNGELAWSTRREVLKVYTIMINVTLWESWNDLWVWVSIVMLQVLGIMGALDPHIHKRNQQKLPGPHGEVTRAASDTGQHIVSMEELPTDLWPSFAASEDYYSTVMFALCLYLVEEIELLSHSMHSTQS